MIRAETLDAARSSRLEIRNPEFGGAITYFFESPGEPPPAPQAFLVEQNPGIVLRPHFHPQHQFQVVADGEATLGRHALTPFSVHYTSPESGYGPIVSGPHGLSYLTLRAVTCKGAHYLPESRGQMHAGLAKQQITVEAPAISHAAALRSRSKAMCEVLIAPHDSGLAAWLLRVPPGGKVRAPSIKGGGRFHVVVAGAMLLGDKRYPRLSPVFVSANERKFSASADEEGLEVMVLQFPVDALQVHSLAA